MIYSEPKRRFDYGRDHHYPDKTKLPLFPSRTTGGYSDADILHVQLAMSWCSPSVLGGQSNGACSRSYREGKPMN